MLINDFKLVKYAGKASWTRIMNASQCTFVALIAVWPDSMVRCSTVFIRLLERIDWAPNAQRHRTATRNCRLREKLLERIYWIFQVKVSPRQMMPNDWQ